MRLAGSASENAPLVGLALKGAVVPTFPSPPMNSLPFLR